MNRWHLEEDKKEYFLSLVKPFMSYLENLTEEMVDEILQYGERDKLYLHLSDSGINPWQLRLILEKLGYEKPNRTATAGRWISGSICRVRMEKLSHLDAKICASKPVE